MRSQSVRVPECQQAKVRLCPPAAAWYLVVAATVVVAGALATAQPRTPDQPRRNTVFVTALSDETAAGLRSRASRIASSSETCRITTGSP